MTLIRNLFALCLLFGLFMLPVLARAAEEGNYTVQTKEKLRQIDLNAADANKDKKVTYQELINYALAKFSFIDTDNNATLNEAELGAYVGTFRVRYEQAFGNSVDNQMRRLKEKYQGMDKNKDAVISRDEYTNFYRQRYGLFDRDDDGVISVKEYRMDVERTPYISR